ncbi:MAG: hypothetical protein ACRDJP_06975, partial [Actinomycetota bacterium]
FRVEEDPSGREVATGVLPAGRAVRAVNEELGVPRVPTFCRFRFRVDEVSGGGGYRLILEEGSPLRFSLDEGARAVTLVIP